MKALQITNSVPASQKITTVLDLFNFINHNLTQLRKNELQIIILPEAHAVKARWEKYVHIPKSITYFVKTCPLYVQ
jgi:hypothetical protein